MTAYSSSGDLTVELRLTDDRGQTDTTTETVTVGTSGPLDPDNLFGDSDNNPVDRSTVMTIVVQEPQRKNIGSFVHTSRYNQLLCRVEPGEVTVMSY